MKKAVKAGENNAQIATTIATNDDQSETDIPAFAVGSIISTSLLPLYSTAEGSHPQGGQTHMNDLTTFSNPEFGQVRTVEINGTPWLVGKDVAVALGYKNPGKAIIAHVD